MATYVTLANWTDQGSKNVKDTLQRTQQFRADCERRGIKVLGVFWTQGRYDMVAFVDAPDEQALMADILAMQSKGNIRTETMRGFTEVEVDAALRKL
jgi:uncharacterized protein with GYD domain